MSDVVKGRSLFRRPDSSTNSINPPILTFMRSLNKIHLDLKQSELTKLQMGRKINTVFEGYTPEIPYGSKISEGILVGRRSRRSKF